MKKFDLLAMASFALMLSACGGGGNGEPAADPNNVGPVTPVRASAEGVYFGVMGTTAAGASDVIEAVLEDDQTWTLVGLAQPEGFTAFGLVQGQGASASGSYSGTGLHVFGGADTAPWNLAATYSDAMRLEGSMTTPDGASPLNAVAVDSAYYDYAAAASLEDIVGSWMMTIAGNMSLAGNDAGQTYNMTIRSNGTWTAGNGVCDLSGTVHARPSGKNVFDLTMQTGSGCAVPGIVQTGIALSYLMADGRRRQLVFAALDASQTHADVMTGAR